MNKLLDKIKLCFELGKVRITFFVAISTSVGYILYSGDLSWDMLFVGLGVFLLAVSSSAINHYQERETDALMERTKNRPIPSGRVKVGEVLIFAVIFALAGLWLIFETGYINGVFLGLLALVWYNVVYTPLKRKYAMAVVPGSLIGAIPPMIGWVAAGGGILDKQILAFALFFFIWQIPHFWLLLLIHGKDYESAGFPTLTKIFNSFQLSRITYVWISSLAVSCLLVPLFSISKNYFTIVGLIFLSIWLMISTKSILKELLEKKEIRKAFINVNVYVLGVIIVISLDKLLL